MKICKFEALFYEAILLLILLLLVSCREATLREISPMPIPTPEATILGTANTSPTRDPLNGTFWVLSSLHGKPPLEGSRITLEFAGGIIRGFAGCNKYCAGYIEDDLDMCKYEAREDASFKVTGFIITLVGCLTPPGANDQEDVYIKALGSTVAYRLVNNHLELQDVTGETILVFRR